MNRIKVMSVFGTRPEAIKMAPLCRLLAEQPEMEHVCVVTGQQRDLLPPILEHFHLRPDYDLDIMQPSQTLTSITEKTIKGLEPVLQSEKPDVLLCHGDTSTAFASALAAFYQKVPVGHVEAGLRTYDMQSPFPEEMNRTLIGHLATFHFAPTARNRDNLIAERISENIFVTGNTVIDAIHQTVTPGYEFDPSVFEKILQPGQKIVLMTAHRRENYGEPLENICRAALALAQRYPELTIVYPVHPSPVVKNTAQGILAGQPNVFLIDPLDVLPMHQLMDRSHFIMTDSGGLQEEAPALGKPVLVLRKETERPEAVEAGTAVLAGIEAARIVELGTALMEDSAFYDSMAKARNPYGDGQASRRIAQALLWHFGLAQEAPQEFAP